MRMRRDRPEPEHGVAAGTPPKQKKSQGGKYYEINEKTLVEYNLSLRNVAVIDARHGAGRRIG